MHKLDPFLRYDREKTFAAHDGTSFETFAKGAALPRDLQLVFNTFARAFFADADKVSLAELIKSFHFYYLSNEAGLLYEYLTDDYDTALLTPLRAHLERHGAHIRTSTPAHALEHDGNVWQLDGEPYDDVIIACDVVGARAITTSSTSLTTRHPDFVRRMKALRPSQRYAVVRLWVDRATGDELPVFVITDKLVALDAVTFYHRITPAERAWADANHGGVYELHCYAVPESLADDVAVRDALVEEMFHFLPALRGARIVHEHVYVRRDFTAFHVGMWAERPTVDTPAPGLHLAGDWVRLDHPAMLMEAACMSGMLAANRVLSRHGAREAPVYSVPGRGILAR
jgi:isorenieratene synthase